VVSLLNETDGVSLEGVNDGFVSNKIVRWQLLKVYLPESFVGTGDDSCGISIANPSTDPSYLSTPRDSPIWEDYNFNDGASLTNNFCSETISTNQVNLLAHYGAGATVDENVVTFVRTFVNVDYYGSLLKKSYLIQGYGSDQTMIFVDGEYWRGSELCDCHIGSEKTNVDISDNRDFERGWHQIVIKISKSKQTSNWGFR